MILIIVSKATKRHCAGTVQSQGGRVGNVKQVGSEICFYTCSLYCEMQSLLQWLAVLCILC